ncbi:MAG: tetratricopeptide repeat protein [Phycisphaerae bacterium]
MHKRMCEQPQMWMAGNRKSVPVHGKHPGRWLPVAVIVTTLGLIAGCATPVPHRSPAGSLSSGYQAYEQGHFLTAESIARSFISTDFAGKNIAEAYYLAAIAEEHQDELALAAQDYRAAIAHSQRPDLQAKSYKALGDISYIMARFGQAVENYKKFLFIDPTAVPDARMLYRLGVSLQNSGHWNGARQYLDKLLSSFPKSQLAKNALQRLSMNHFALQFGAWNNSPAAWRQVTGLQARGVGAAVVPQIIGGHTLFLVQGGVYSTYGAALAARRIAAVQAPQVIVVP